VVLEDIAFELPERGALAVLGRNGVGKTTLSRPSWVTRLFTREASNTKASRSAGLPVYERCRLGVGLVPQTRDIFPSLSVEENLTVAAPRPLDAGTRLRSLSEARRAARALGQPDLGRRTADARDRASG